MVKSPIRLLLVMSALVILTILVLQPLSVFHFEGDIEVLFPKGIVALKERNLLFVLQGLMLIVVIPVYVFTFIFSWKYRASNKNAIYDPDLVDNHVAEYFWWGVPCIITLAMSIITWQSTHELDPYKPLQSDKKALTIQVVALNWKWLFIYPEEKIATVNFIQFPKERPIHFEITADAPMNSFWIPRLGGQIYAMANMKTELNLMASELGDFRGSSANISGEGFSGMTFIARASSEEDYEKWLKTAQESTQALDLTEYNKIVLPSQRNPVVLYQLKDEDLFTKIMNKYMHPQGK
ncbi:MAG: ubiquinol oxidase subunit II [Chlamydiota bacterium]